jgi:hypothetical protein
VAPFFVLCDPGDLETEHVHPYQQRPRPPRVQLFDARPGGTGVAEALFAVMPAVLAKVSRESGAGEGARAGAPLESR